MKIVFEDFNRPLQRQLPHLDHCQCDVWVLNESFRLKAVSAFFGKVAALISCFNSTQSRWWFGSGPEAAATSSVVSPCKGFCLNKKDLLDEYVTKLLQAGLIKLRWNLIQNLIQKDLMATQRFFRSINHGQVVILSPGFPFPGTFSGVLAITPHFTTCFLLNKKAANDAGTACSCTYASIFAAMKNAWAERRYAHSAYRDRRVRQSAAHFRALLHIATTRHFEDLSRKASVLINGILLTFQ